jgi:hypothetical protein
MALAKRAPVDSAIEAGAIDADDKVILNSEAALSILESEPLGVEEYNPVRGIWNGLLIGAALWLAGIISTFAFLR